MAGADRITSAGSTTYTWNNDGTLASRTTGGATTSFSWDYDAQLTAISTGPSFAYDATGRRVSRTAGGVTTTFLVDGSAVVLEKQGGATTRSYTHGNGLLTQNAETLHFDGHGTLRTVTNGAQAILATGNYEAYGQSVGGSGSYSTSYQYGATSGYRTDGDAGLLHIGARWYDPVIGRWISADTYLGQIGEPLSRNRYLYCDSDPVNQVDPSGHWGLGELVGLVVIGAAIGFVAGGGAEGNLVGGGVGAAAGAFVGVILWMIGGMVTVDTDPYKGGAPGHKPGPIGNPGGF